MDWSGELRRGLSNEQKETLRTIGKITIGQGDQRLQCLQAFFQAACDFRSFRHSFIPEHTTTHAKRLHGLMVMMVVAVVMVRPVVMVVAVIVIMVVVVMMVMRVVVSGRGRGGSCGGVLVR